MGRKALMDNPAKREGIRYERFPAADDGDKERNRQPWQRDRRPESEQRHRWSYSGSGVNARVQTTSALIETKPVVKRITKEPEVPLSPAASSLSDDGSRVSDFELDSSGEGGAEQYFFGGLDAPTVTHTTAAMRKFTPPAISERVVKSKKLDEDIRGEDGPQSRRR